MQGHDFISFKKIDMDTLHALLNFFVEPGHCLILLIKVVVEYTKRKIGKLAGSNYLNYFKLFLLHCKYV